MVKVSVMPKHVSLLRWRKRVSIACLWHVLFYYCLLCHGMMMGQTYVYLTLVVVDSLILMDYFVYFVLVAIM